MVDNNSLLSATVILIAEVSTACPRWATTPITNVVSEASQRTFEDWRSYPQCNVVLCRYPSLTGSHWTCASTDLPHCYLRISGAYTVLYKEKTASGPCTRRCNGRVHDRERGLYTAIYTYTQPVYKTYRICNFLTSVNKAKHHIACHRKFMKYGVKWDLR